MQFSTWTVLAALASFSYAQTIQDELAKIPACGITCITAATTKAGCAAYDFTCQCGSAREAITQDAIPCVASTCQANDLAVITQASTEICRLALLGNMTSSASPSATGALPALSPPPFRLPAQPPLLPTSTNTGNAAEKVRFGAAGVAVGMGAVVAALVL